MSFICQNETMKSGKNHIKSIATEPKVRDSSSLGRATKTAQTFVCAVFVMRRKQARIGCPLQGQAIRVEDLAPLRGQNSLGRAKNG